MMSSDTFEKVNSVQEPYISISSNISGIRDKRLPELMVRLLKDNALFRKFEQDPEETLADAGVDPKSVDVKMFIDLANLLHTRTLKPQDETGPEQTIEQREQNQGNQNNWDHSRSSFTRYESQYNIWSERGASKERDRSESQTTNRGFDRRGIDSVNKQLIEDEVDKLFFPSHPLVTPELLKKIKLKLAESSRD
jgi:hypothetical protein